MTSGGKKKKDAARQHAKRAAQKASRRSNRTKRDRGTGQQAKSHDGRRLIGSLDDLATHIEETSLRDASPPTRTDILRKCSEADMPRLQASGGTKYQRENARIAHSLFDYWDLFCEHVAETLTERYAINDWREVSWACRWGCGQSGTGWSSLGPALSRAAHRIAAKLPFPYRNLWAGQLVEALLYAQMPTNTVELSHLVAGTSTIHVFTGSKWSSDLLELQVTSLAALSWYSDDEVMAAVGELAADAENIFSAAFQFHARVPSAGATVGLRGPEAPTADDVQQWLTRAGLTRTAEEALAIRQLTVTTADSAELRARLCRARTAFQDGLQRWAGCQPGREVVRTARSGDARDLLVQAAYDFEDACLSLIKTGCRLELRVFDGDGRPNGVSSPARAFLEAAVSFDRAADVCRRLGDQTSALTLAKRSVVWAYRSGHAERVGDSLNNLGITHHLRGDILEARDAFTRSASYFRMIDDWIRTSAGVSSRLRELSEKNLTRLLNGQEPDLTPVSSRPRLQAWEEFDFGDVRVTRNPEER